MNTRKPKRKVDYRDLPSDSDELNEVNNSNANIADGAPSPRKRRKISGVNSDNQNNFFHNEKQLTSSHHTIAKSSQEIMLDFITNKFQEINHLMKSYSNIFGFAINELETSDVLKDNEQSESSGGTASVEASNNSADNQNNDTLLEANNFENDFYLPTPTNPDNDLLKYKKDDSLPKVNIVSLLVENDDNYEFLPDIPIDHSFYNEVKESPHDEDSYDIFPHSPVDYSSYKEVKESRHNAITMQQDLQAPTSNGIDTNDNNRQVNSYLSTTIHLKPVFQPQPVQTFQQFQPQPVQTFQQFQPQPLQGQAFQKIQHGTTTMHPQQISLTQRQRCTKTSFSEAEKQALKMKLRQLRSDEASLFTDTLYRDEESWLRQNQNILGIHLIRRNPKRNGFHIYFDNPDKWNTFMRASNQVPVYSTPNPFMFNQLPDMSFYSATALYPVMTQGLFKNQHTQTSLINNHSQRLYNLSPESSVVPITAYAISPIATHSNSFAPNQQPAPFNMMPGTPSSGGFFSHTKPISPLPKMAHDLGSNKQIQTVATPKV